MLTFGCRQYVFVSLYLCNGRNGSEAHFFVLVMQFSSRCVVWLVVSIVIEIR
jgi:hypothetical protein